MSREYAVQRLETNYAALAKLRVSHQNLLRERDALIADAVKQGITWAEIRRIAQVSYATINKAANF